MKRPARFVLRLFLTILLLSLSVIRGFTGEGKIKVLIFSGQNNHKWQETTPELQRILTASGRFSVEVTDHPEATQPESLSGYDVILSNWNVLGGKDAVKEWPAPLREAFLNFVRNGKGYVVVHAGGTSFMNWKEYHQLIGGTWGQGTGHGPFHKFTVKITDQNHPITRGVEPFETSDELWHRMVVQPEKTVLATAFSAPEHKGTGADEPMVMVTQFGKGRCFNLVLGHNVQAMSSMGFQTLLLRGTEWAATGTVSETQNPQK